MACIIRTLTENADIKAGKFYFNGGKVFTSVMKNANGKGYVVMATNVEKGASIDVSDVKETYQDALEFAMRYARVIRYTVDHEAYEMQLSERQGW
jgi:hypothetical protein